jgi:hypothetical protein
MRLKGRSGPEVRKWKKQQAELGYLPHYHKKGRILWEVRFVFNSADSRHAWTVQPVGTSTVLRFRKNGTPLNGTEGKLVGPLVLKRKVIRR